MKTPKGAPLPITETGYRSHFTGQAQSRMLADLWPLSRRGSTKPRKLPRGDVWKRPGVSLTYSHREGRRPLNGVLSGFIACRWRCELAQSRGHGSDQQGALERSAPASNTAALTAEVRATVWRSTRGAVRTGFSLTFKRSPHRLWTLRQRP